VLSTGSDPVADFNRFAEKMNMSKKKDEISLGRGMGPQATEMIE
jgi:dynein heavy chain